MEDSEVVMEGDGRCGGGVVERVERTAVMGGRKNER